MTEKKIIKETIMKILNQYGVAAEKIIVFGSRAREDFKKSSDWDLLIIMRKNVSREEKREIAYKIRKELAGIYIPCDVIIKAEDEVEERKKVIGSVVRSAIKRGVVL